MVPLKGQKAVSEHLLMEEGPRLVLEGHRLCHLFGVSKGVKGLQGVDPAVEAVLFHVVHHDLLHGVHGHPPFELVLGQEVGKVGRLEALPPPVHQAQVEDHRLELREVLRQ